MSFDDCDPTCHRRWVLVILVINQDSILYIYQTCTSVKSIHMQLIASCESMRPHVTISEDWGFGISPIHTIETLSQDIHLS